MTYRHFKYPLEHVHGSITCENNAVSLDLGALIGNEPARATGTIDDLGDDAVVQLTFEFRRMPIDRTLLDAFQPRLRKVVHDFQPTGSARGYVHLLRRPSGPDDPPEGKIQINANLELNEEDRCAMTWAGLPYPVEALQGRLELHPGYWLFEKIRGRNGLAILSGSGRVDEIEGRDRLRRYKVDLNLSGRHVVFDDQLRRALPMEWRESWKVLNPEGACSANCADFGRAGQAGSLPRRDRPRGENPRESGARPRQRDRLRRRRTLDFSAVRGCQGTFRFRRRQGRDDRRLVRLPRRLGRLSIGDGAA